MTAQPRRVRIFAAASLTDALSQAVSLFERSHPGVRVIPQFGSSSDLARQIVAGAPAHLFYSADERQMDRVAEEGFFAHDRRRDVLSNRLVIVVSRESRLDIAGPEQLGSVERIAMGDPEVVPAGVYARLYLEKLGLWQALRMKIVPTLDVRAALAAVASGNVPAGFVYRTDAAIEDRVEVAYDVPSGEGPRIVYPLALLGGSPSSEARALFDFLLSREAGSTFERHGFVWLRDEVEPQRVVQDGRKRTRPTPVARRHTSRSTRRRPCSRRPSVFDHILSMSQPK